MTRDDIIRMAKESTAPEWWDEGMGRFHMGMDFVAFAALVAAAEREECAKVCESWSEGHAKDAGGCTYESCDFVCAATDCAEAIRARGTQSNEAQNANG